jgi:tetratricopeptide (TPR) repeat protein
MKAAFILTSTPGPAERELAAAAPRVVLEPLGAKEMPDLAAELFGRVVAGPRFFDRLQRVSGGLPGKAAQWLIHLSKNGALKRRGEKHVEVPGVEWGTPPGIQQSLVGPLGGLPPEQRRILDAAAIVGVEFTTTPVAVLTGSSVHRAEQGLATLEARGLIVSDGVGYAFVDPAMRESLRDLVPEAERRDLCRRLAEFLAGTDGDDEQVALHFWEARDPLAIPRLERLVRRALGRDDVDLAHDLATRLDSLLPEARRWEGQAIIGEVLERRGNFTEAARCYIEASRAAGSRRIPLLLDAARAHQKERAAGKAGEVADRVLAESRDERERAVAQLYRLSALEEQGRLDEARSALDEAAAVFEKLQDVTMIGRAHHARGLLQYHAARAEDALAEFIKARQYGLAAGSHEDSAKACNNLAITYRLLGDTERAFAMQWEAVRSFQRIGDAGTAAACYHNLAWFYMDAGDFGASAASFRQSLDLCELSGIPGREAVPLSGLAGLEHARGNLKEALELTRRGLELRERLGWTDLMPDELASYAMRLIDIGDIAGAREVATRALVHEHRLSPMAVGPELAMGAVHLAAGEVDEAERTFRKALDGALAAKVVDMEYHARLRLAEILAARGAADGSVAEAEKALELVKDAGHRAQLPHAYRILGVARLGAGDLAGAGMALELGLDLAEEMGERLDRARCERDLAEVDLRSGRREAGMERLISAAGAFTQIGAIPDLERTKTLLGKAL